MAFYEKEELYLETDALGMGLGASLLQVKDGMWFPGNKASDIAVIWPITFVNKSLTSAKNQHNLIDRKALGIQHGLENFHYCCFACDVSIITDHKLLVAIFKK